MKHKLINIGILFSGVFVLLLFMLLGSCLLGCKTSPPLEVIYKAKCTSIQNDEAVFTYLYDCKQSKPCAIIFQTSGSKNYEVGKYYLVRYRRETK